MISGGTSLKCDLTIFTLAMKSFISGLGYNIIVLYISNSGNCHLLVTKVFIIINYGNRFTHECNINYVTDFIFCMRISLVFSGLNDLK